MTITNSEKMAVGQTHDMWLGHKGILILFMWIVRVHASFGCEGELRDDVYYLALYQDFFVENLSIDATMLFNGIQNPPILLFLL